MMGFMKDSNPSALNAKSWLAAIMKIKKEAAKQLLQ